MMKSYLLMFKMKL